MQSVEADIMAALVPACRDLGVELFDVELRQNTVQVTVEATNQLDLDAVAAVSRAISDFLDAHEELVPLGHYELEVSSPGLERKLRRPEHFKMAIGEQVSVRTRAGAPGPRRLEGVIIAVRDEQFDLRVSETTEHTIGFRDVERAHKVVDWSAVFSSKSASQVPVDGQVRENV